MAVAVLERINAFRPSTSRSTNFSLAVAAFGLLAIGRLRDESLRRQFPPKLAAWLPDPCGRTSLALALVLGIPLFAGPMVLAVIRLLFADSVGQAVGLLGVLPRALLVGLRP